MSGSYIKKGGREGRKNRRAGREGSWGRRERKGDGGGSVEVDRYLSTV